MQSPSWEQILRINVLLFLFLFFLLSLEEAWQDVSRVGEEVITKETYMKRKFSRNTQWFSRGRNPKKQMFQVLTHHFLKVSSPHHIYFFLRMQLFCLFVQKGLAYAEISTLIVSCYYYVLGGPAVQNLSTWTWRLHEFIIPILQSSKHVYFGQIISKPQFPYQQNRDCGCTQFLKSRGVSEIIHMKWELTKD